MGIDKLRLITETPVSPDFCDWVNQDIERGLVHRKRRQLTRVARYFLAARAAHEAPCRFDVVAVVMPDRGKPIVEHFINAFEPAYH